MPGLKDSRDSPMAGVGLRGTKKLFGGMPGIEITIGGVKVLMCDDSRAQK